MSRALVEKFMVDLERRDAEALRGWFTDESVLWMPPSEPATGARRILTMFKLIFRKYTDLHWKVAEIYDVGAGRCVYLTESWGTIGTGTPYKNDICTIIEFDAAGQIKFLSDYFKDTAIFSSDKPVS